MSTRCQIGFYASHDQPLSEPNVVIYRHCDGYPHDGGVIDDLLPWDQKWSDGRGFGDSEYAAARGLVALMKAHGGLDSDTGYGICGDRELHGDIEYYYRVDPFGIYVYEVGGDETFADLERDTPTGHLFKRQP